MQGRKFLSMSEVEVIESCMLVTSKRRNVAPSDVRGVAVLLMTVIR